MWGRSGGAEAAGLCQPCLLPADSEQQGTFWGRRGREGGQDESRERGVKGRRRKNG